MELSPPLKKSQFIDIINNLNNLDLKEWIFCPGMLFRSGQKWWGDRGYRESAHEGLDLLTYRNNKGDVLRLDEKTELPAIYDGTVIKIIDDFIGKSIFVEHGGGFFTAFSHITPLKGIEEGTKMNEGDIIATITEISDPESRIAPHLHITAGWLSDELDYETLDWDMIGDSRMISLVNPLDIIGIDPATLDEYTPECIDL